MTTEQPSLLTCYMVAHGAHAPTGHLSARVTLVDDRGFDVV